MCDVYVMYVFVCVCVDASAFWLMGKEVEAY